jgi:hypothetical protein
MQIITLHAAEIANKLRHASRTDRDGKRHHVSHFGKRTNELSSPNKNELRG